MQVYESMPVEEFGMAMLRGMGWREGEGVGLRRQVRHTHTANNHAPTHTRLQTNRRTASGLLYGKSSTTVCMCARARACVCVCVCLCVCVCVYAHRKLSR